MIDWLVRNLKLCFTFPSDEDVTPSRGIDPTLPDEVKEKVLEWEAARERFSRLSTTNILNKDPAERIKIAVAYREAQEEYTRTKEAAMKAMGDYMKSTGAKHIELEDDA